MTNDEETTFKQVLEALLDLEAPFHPRYLYYFSDINPRDLRAFQETWPQVPAWRRQAILEDIEELSESNYTLSFEKILRHCIQDSEPKVRELAIRSLWEYDSPDLAPIFLDMLTGDQNPDVRAVVASALGKYIYLGELEELQEDTLHAVEEKLLHITRSKEAEVIRQHALESLGFSSRSEVPGLIEEAYYTGLEQWVISALVAMGRSANRAWNRLVIDMLENDSPEIRAEAARAAGELEIGSAATHLLDMLDDEHDEVRLAAIWSLSQIGGEGVEEILEQLYDAAIDEDEASFIEQAIDNLAFTQDMKDFTLLEIFEDEEDDSGDLYSDLRDESN